MKSCIQLCNIYFFCISSEACITQTFKTFCDPSLVGSISLAIVMSRQQVSPCVLSYACFLRDPCWPSLPLTESSTCQPSLCFVLVLKTANLQAYKFIDSAWSSSRSGGSSTLLGSYSSHYLTFKCCHSAATWASDISTITCHSHFLHCQTRRIAQTSVPCPCPFLGCTWIGQVAVMCCHRWSATVHLDCSDWTVKLQVLICCQTFV